jgi:hypothetical protein
VLYPKKLSSEICNYALWWETLKSNSFDLLPGVPGSDFSFV